HRRRPPGRFRVGSPAMIHSMTGFGNASAHVDATHYAVEIRSVNNRYLKPTLRLPEALAGLEPKLEARLRKALGRGSVTYTLHLKTDAADAALEVNTAALQSYVDALKPFADADRPVDLASLLTLPGVLADPAAEPTDLLKQHEAPVLELTDKALATLVEHRRAEGRALQGELDKHLDVIAANVERVAEKAPRIVKDYHRRLTARVNELITEAALKVEESELIREVAVFAEKADVAEEIQRLGHHVEHFRSTCQQDAAQAGRKLDFLTQEMLREANTIGSKANDADIAAHVVDIKGAIDRLKEQVQNVE
ncbi:MAG: YicC/YloC family endoribonuclease, partial [Planctomycetota bacterium]